MRTSQYAQDTSHLTGPAILNDERPFSYTVTAAAALLPGAMVAAIPLIFDIAASYDFLWSETTYFADVAGAVQTDGTRVVPEIMAQFFQNQEPFQDAEVPLNSIAGPGQRPYSLTTPWWLPGTTKLTLQVRNASAATAYNLWVTITGLHRTRKD